MCGWLLCINQNINFEKELKKFKQTFTIEGLPRLNIRKTGIGSDGVLLSWAWTTQEYFPDMTVCFNDAKECVIIIEGTVTDLGAHGRADSNREETAKKILALWNSRGKDILAELNGSFSMVIFNRTSGETVCITDRIASRALWYSQEGDTLYFGNFPSTIAVFRNEINLDGAGLWSLLAASRPTADRSLFYEIRSLQAGQVGHFGRAGRRSISDWYILRYQPEQGVSASEWGERIAGALKASAGRLLTYSPSPYLFLSGGLDSRIAAGVLGSAVKTLTLTTQANMNSRIAERVAGRLGIEHETITRDPYYYLDTFGAAALVGSGNYNIAHAHFIKTVIRVTAERGDCTFLLGDLLENFNKHYFKPGIRHRLDGLRPEDFPLLFDRLLYYSYDFDEVQALFNPDIGARCRESWARKLVKLVRQIYAVSGDTRDVLDALARWYNNNFFPSNLMHDCIKPFARVNNLMWDNPMFDLMQRVPAAVKGKGMLHRATLRCLDRGLLLVPDANSWLPPVVPTGLNRLVRRIRPVLGKVRRKCISIYRRDNRPVVRTEGSWHMLHEFFRKDPQHKEFIQNVLFDREAAAGEILDNNMIRHYWELFQAGDLSKTFIINMVLTFALIHRRIPTKGIKCD